MWPSFSLWAWRILKMRSCLRRPEVPAMSRPRASLLSSAMLCSLGSEIVIFTWISRGDLLPRGEIAWRQAVAGICVSSRKDRNSEARQDVMDYTLAGGLKCSENFVGLPVDGAGGRAFRPGRRDRAGLGRAALLERDVVDAWRSGCVHGRSEERRVRER